MDKSFADTLIKITERHANDISKQWCRAVRSNPRTEAYHRLTEKECFPQAVEFYKNLRKIYFSERPYTELQKYFSSYAKQAYNNKIPLSEALYSLIMMRRHIWLFAEFQETFATATEHRQVVESVNKTIRIFDHGIYIVTRYYEEMNQKHPGGPS
jgi:hypothetical protein